MEHLYQRSVEMTPQQIDDYKRQWMPGYTVRLHSDLESQGKDWCKRVLAKEQWHFRKWTNVYEHTFQFENIMAAQNFEMEFGSFANQ